MDPRSSTFQYPIACDSVIGRYCFQSAAEGLQRINAVEPSEIELFPTAQSAKWIDLLSLKGIVVLAWDFRVQLFSYFGIPIER